MRYLILICFISLTVIGQDVKIGGIGVLRSSNGTASGLTLDTAVTNSHLTASRVLVLDSAKRQTNSVVTGHELNSLSGGKVYNVKAPEYGAIGDGVTDDAAAIQAAMDAASEAGGNVYIPSGVYLIGQSLDLPHRVNLHGSAAGWLGSSFGYAGTNVNGLKGVSVLRAAPGLNAPILMSTTTNAAVRDGQASYDGRTDITQYFQNSTISHLVFDGDADNQTAWNSDCIYFQDKFGITLEHLFLFRPKGYLARIWNCNVVNFRNVDAIGRGPYSKGFIFYDTSDTIVDGCMMGGIIGPAVWLSTQGAILTSIVGGHYGDTASNATFPAVTGIASDVITTDVEVGVETGDPVTFHIQSGGAYPTGLIQGKTYFAIRLTATTFKVATSIVDAEAGIGDAISGGSLVIMQPGPHVALYLNDGAIANVISGSRFDNARESCVLVETGYGNVISGNNISRAGSNQANAGYSGIHFATGGNNNFATGNTIYRCDTGITLGLSVNRLGLNTYYLVDTDVVSAMTGGTVSPKANGLGVLTVENEQSILMTLERTNAVSAKFGIGLTTPSVDALFFNDVQAGKTITAMMYDGSRNVVTLGLDGQTSAIGRLGTGTPAVSADAAANTLQLYSYGRGAGASGTISLLTGVTGSSGTTVQSLQTGLSVAEKLVTVPNGSLVVGASLTNGSAKLQVDSTTLGFLPPRMTKAQRDAISSPADGLMVYQTDNTAGPRYYSGSVWRDPPLYGAGSPESSATANVGSIYLDTTNGDLYQKEIGSAATGWVRIPSNTELDTSAEIAGIVGDETGSGALVFGTSPTLTTPAADSLTVNDDAYAAGWNGSTNVPTKNAVYDKIEAMGTSPWITEAADVYALRNGTSAQTAYIYRTYTDASNYARTRFVYSGNDFLIDTVGAGTGTVGDLVLARSGSTRMTVGNTQVVFAVGYSTPVRTISASAIVWSDGNTFTKTIAGNTTFTFSGATAGQWITVKVTNGGAHTVTWPTVTWKGGVTPTQTANKTDFYKLFYDGTTYWGEAVQDF